jgi:hypothetical protein
MMFIREDSEAELRAVEVARIWAKRSLHAALAQPALGKPWTVYCRTFDHELWMRLCADRGVFP